MKLLHFFVCTLVYHLTNQAEIQYRIINGYEVDILPYQVGIYIHKKWVEDGWCGGSLISNKHILTAQHCLNHNITATAFKLDIYLGSSELWKGERITCEDCWKNYPGHHNVHDISIITLPKEIEFTDKIYPIKLPSKWDNQLELSGKTGMISGWGDTELGYPSSTLRAVNITILPPATCLEITQQIDFICAPVTDKSSSFGDSGGPLVINGKLFGIVSGWNTLKVTYPNSYYSVGYAEVTIMIFTRVTNYLDWIVENTKIILDN